MGWSLIKVGWDSFSKYVITQKVTKRGSLSTTARILCPQFKCFDKNLCTKTKYFKLLHQALRGTLWIYIFFFTYFYITNSSDISHNYLNFSTFEKQYLFSAHVLKGYFINSSSLQFFFRYLFLTVFDQKFYIRKRTRLMCLWLYKTSVPPIVT